MIERSIATMADELELRSREQRIYIDGLRKKGKPAWEMEVKEGRLAILEDAAKFVRGLVPKEDPPASDEPPPAPPMDEDDDDRMF